MKLNKLLLSATIAGSLIACSNGSTPQHKTSDLWFQNQNKTYSTAIEVADTTPTLTIVKKELALVNACSIKCIINEALYSEQFEIHRNADNSLTLQSGSAVGLLYGAYELQRTQSIKGANFIDSIPLNSCIKGNPDYDIRILNHWDNLDGTVERGYAGKSLWKWEEMDSIISPRYEAYARANASIGINATVLNNVNASPEILSEPYLKKVTKLADVFRPYGIKVYLAVNFSSPMALGKLEDADPLRPEVRTWWKEKADEIYKMIPDFGGFLVKANSEGLPGPLDYNRSHADGANMLAEALKPHGGIVMWRAFVYSPSDADRAKQAYLEFQPHDGEFADNVIIQIKNGPIDFQPREPISPLFAAMPNTQVMAELQITQEYTGHSNHICFLPNMWLEALLQKTSSEENSSVADITLQHIKDAPSAIAGVTNIGDNESWCGNTMAQANWYAFGRIAWDTSLTSEEIAHEWIRQTFNDICPKGEETIAEILDKSHEAVVDYMMPLGLHHIFAWGHHYGPEPWCNIEGARPDWMPSYYHRADSIGVGFDRSATGSNGHLQYKEPLASLYGNINTCPDEYLLWFHHATWDHWMQSGRRLWEELCFRYNRGCESVFQFRKQWESVKDCINDELYNEIAHKLNIQYEDAVWWHDACLLYFQQYSKKGIPQGTTHELDDMMNFKLNITNYECPDESMLRTWCK